MSPALGIRPTCQAPMDKIFAVLPQVTYERAHLAV
jgi:hypothetical protein